MTTGSDESQSRTACHWRKAWDGFVLLQDGQLLTQSEIFNQQRLARAKYPV